MKRDDLYKLFDLLNASVFFSSVFLSLRAFIIY